MRAITLALLLLGALLGAQCALIVGPSDEVPGPIVQGTSLMDTIVFDSAESRATLLGEEGMHPWIPWGTARLRLCRHGRHRSSHGRCAMS